MLTFLLFSILVSFTSAFSWKELPKPSCVAGSKVCSDACFITRCSVFNNVSCVSDNCGCEAKFFRWMESEKAYHDVTNVCAAGKEIKAIAKVVHDVQNDESADVQAAVNPETVVKLFKNLNLLTSEAFQNIAAYLKTVAESNPTEENLRKYSAAIDGLRSLQRSKRVWDTGVEERFIGAIIKGISTAVKVGKAIYNAVKNDEIADFSYDTNIEGRYVAPWVKGISTGIKAAHGIAEIASAGKEQKDSGDFFEGNADQSDNQVFVMDENTGEVFAARAFPKIPAKVKQGVKQFCKGFVDGLCSDPVPADDAQADVVHRHLVETSAKKDLEIAADLIAADGTFSDVIADLEARAEKSMAEKCGRFLGKLTKIALTTAIAAGCTAAIG